VALASNEKYPKFIDVSRRRFKAANVHSSAFAICPSLFGENIKTLLRY
jgi:hypothetical protein